jgi:hypothetical protein
MYTSTERKTLGIMVVTSRTARRGSPPFGDRGFYRRLSRIGQQAGVDVIVFDPLHTSWSTLEINGYQFDAHGARWIKVQRPVPPVIYDRCFYSGRSQYLRYKQAINRLRRLKSVRCILCGLSGKWQVHEMLNGHPKLRSYLPETQQLADIRQVTEWLDQRGSCVLKPNAGSHGKKILRITKLEAGGYEVSGRDALNRPLSAAFDALPQLLRWLNAFVSYRRYLLQESLSLTTSTGRSFDVRSLVQKGGDGKWQLTGMAIRLGRPGSLTANIHGGGESRPLLPFLREQYDEAIAEVIVSDLEMLSRLIPLQLEKQAGPLFELGIDFGIDRDGRVWILEVNSKPGRSIFTQLHDVSRSKASVHNLISYARYLLDRQLGGLAK